MKKYEFFVATLQSYYEKKLKLQVVRIGNDPCYIYSWIKN